MNKTVTIFLAALALTLSPAALAQQSSSRVQTLRGADAAATDQAPPERVYAGQFPGSQKPIARTFSTQPPVIPHTIEDLDTITLQDNPCLGCHGAKNYKSVNAPKPSDAHFRGRDGKLLSEISAARYQCTACHVPQADAKPFVENTFRGNAARRTK